MKGKGKNSALSYIMDRSLDLVFTIDRQGIFLKANNTAHQKLGHSFKEFTGQSAENILHLHHPGSTLLQALEANSSLLTEGFIQLYEEQIAASFSAVFSPEDDCYFCIAYLNQSEPTEETRLKEMDRLLREQGAEMHALVDEHGNYLYGNRSYLSKWGYDADQLAGANAFSLIHPDDVSKSEKVFHQVSQSKETFYLDEIRFRTASGQLRWLKAAISNQLDNPALKAFFISFSDITLQKEAELRLQESEYRFRSLFNNNPDMIIFQNEEGIILDANPTFLNFHKKQREEVINHPVYEFLPLETETLAESTHVEAMAGKQVSFIAEINFNTIGYKILSIKKVPLAVEGKIVAVHVVLRDITAEMLAQKTLEQQARKLNTIFESITDAFCTLDKNWNFSYFNSECARILEISEEEVLGKSVWELFPEEEGGIFYQHYFQAIRTNKAVHFVGYLSRAQSWLEVKAFPSEEGLSIYFDDITAKVNANQELEKLSLVAQKTTNSVIITDANGYTEWVNKGFTNMTGYTLPEVKGNFPFNHLYGPETDPATKEKIEEDFLQQKPFSFAVLIYKKNGAKFWCYTEVTPILDDKNQVTKYIGVQSDISVRKEEETQILKMAQDLYQKNSDLQQFTYIISHNLRAPVANALGFADLLLKLNKESERFDPALKYLKDSITRLDGVLRDVSQILSVRDQRDTVGFECICVKDAWEQAQNDMIELLEQFYGKVEVNIEDKLLVHANRAYLHSIFYNLLSNAIKYRSEERNLLIRVEAFTKKEGGIMFRFSDNGLGLDMEKVGKDLFKMYKRFHPGKDGKGIGLFLVKSHVEAMEGTIEVDSQVNVGTTFTLHLKEGEYSRSY